MSPGKPLRDGLWPLAALAALVAVVAAVPAASAADEVEADAPPAAAATRPAPAQDSTVVLAEDKLPDAQARHQAPGDSLQLDPIIVTATKRPMALREVPASIGVISGAALEEAGALELRDFLGRVPGVQQTEVFTEYNRISVRGIQSDAAAVTPAATGYFVDDVPFSDPFVLHARPDIPPFDLDAVEVLKGPQGTLFGASALSGAVRYRTIDARPAETGGHGFIQTRNPTDGQPERAGGLAVNLPLGENAGLRVVGVSRLGGGRIDDLRQDVADTDKSRRYNGRALLRWDGGGRWTFGLKAHLQTSRADDVPQAETTDGRLERSRALRAAPTAARFGFGTLDATVRFDVADLVMVSSVVDKSSYLSGRNAARTLGAEDAGQPISSPVSEDIQGQVHEMRLVSATSDHGWQWLAGIYYHRYADFSTQRVYADGEAVDQLPVLLDFVADIRAQERAAFGELGLPLRRGWLLNLGLRGYQVETAGEVVSSGLIILATGETENRNDARIRESGLNPRLALSFQPKAGFSAYLSASRGFRFGGIQIVGPSPVSPNVPPTYDSDTLWNFELGLRGEWLEKRLQTDLALFYIDWDDPQLQTTTGGAVPLNTVDNVGHARSQGGELSLQWRPGGPGLALGLAAAYTDARTTVAYTTPSGDQAPAGSRLPGTARHQLVATLDYDWRWGDHRLRFGLAHQRLGPGYSDILHQLDIFDFSTTDLRLSWQQPRWLGRTRLSAGINNLGDARGLTQALVLSEDNFTTMYNNTRSVDVRLDFAF